MDESLTKDLKQQYNDLPPEMQEAISDINLPEKLEQITRNNKLMIDQAGTLQTETILVLFGIVPLTDYISNLVKNADMTKEQALAVAHDADELIFKNIRDTLRAINEAATAAENEATKPADTPSKEEMLAGIENPESIGAKEQSVSFSALDSNNQKEKTADENINGIEIRKDLVPEIAPRAMLPIKPVVPYHENISPVENIVQTKMTETVAVPKEVIVVEEKTKLPEKKSEPIPKATSATDPYREPIE